MQLCVKKLLRADYVYCIDDGNNAWAYAAIHLTRRMI